MKPSSKAQLTNEKVVSTNLQGYNEQLEANCLNQTNSKRIVTELRLQFVTVANYVETTLPSSNPVRTH